MDDISIDRLVLNLPGLSADEARQVAKQVGEKLAAAKPKAGRFPTLTVDINEQAVSRDLPRLADAVVESLLEQMG
jgi:hypothetical protein